MSSAKPPLFLNATRDLAAFAAGLKFEDIPPEAIERIKYCALDSIGCCLFGVTLPWTRHVQAMAEAEGAKPVASIYGSGRRTSIAQAVLVNSTAGHAFELDDIHKESIVHPGSLATPVALAYAEAAGGASGRDVITGMIAGYEVGTRVGNAATMSLFLRGFHPQGTSGAFVAAATAGRMVSRRGTNAARPRHRRLAGRRLDGRAGRRHGQALSLRSRRSERRVFRDARETRVHRNHRCA